jgi:CRISPR-associated endonuclease/helicase Cas3
MAHLIEAFAGIGVGEFRGDLERAAALHDWGKAHPVMQETLRGDEPPGELLAKSAVLRRHKRPHFRHELASALAMIAAGESNLAAYLAAAHHGRVRMSIRSMPGEPERTARGIQDGEALPACELAAGILVPEVMLSLEAMKLGMAENGKISWTDRALRLLERLGPFRLAYLEMLLRAADEQASAREKEAKACA